jgi:hypothetical protein
VAVRGADGGGGESDQSVGAAAAADDDRSRTAWPISLAGPSSGTLKIRMSSLHTAVDKDLHESLRWLKRAAAKPSQFQEKAKEGVKFLTRKLGR